MLTLLSLLQTHRYWTGPGLAERLGVSERTLRRDVDRLRSLGYDIDAQRGVAGGYQLRAGKALPPLLLDDEEAVAIAVGLRSATARAIDGGGDAALRALTKLVATLPPALRRRMDALQEATVPGPAGRSPAIDATSLTTLAAACRDHEVVRFRYVSATGDGTQRQVEPHQLVSLGQRWYLASYDLDRDDWRTFRVDRLSKVATSGGRFSPREIPGGSALDLVRRGRDQRERRHAVRIRFAMPAGDLERVVARWGEVQPDGDDHAIWSLRTDTLDWAVMIVAASGVSVEVQEPAELGDLVRSAGRRMAGSST